MPPEASGCASSSRSPSGMHHRGLPPSAAAAPGRRRVAPRTRPRERAGLPLVRRACSRQHHPRRRDLVRVPGPRPCRLVRRRDPAGRLPRLLRRVRTAVAAGRGPVPPPQEGVRHGGALLPDAGERPLQGHALGATRTGGGPGPGVPRGQRAHPPGPDRRHRADRTLVDVRLPGPSRAFGRPDRRTAVREAQERYCDLHSGPRPDRGVRCGTAHRHRPRRDRSRPRDRR